MLSLVELRRAAEAIDLRFAGLRVERVVQPDAFQIVLVCYGRPTREDAGDAGSDSPAGGPVKRHLLVSCDPRFGRVAELGRPPHSHAKPPPFLQFLRPRIEGARVRRARLASGDRLLSIELEGREGSFELLLSLLGKRSNTYLLDGLRNLLGAQRALEKTRRALRIGEPWVDPEAAPQPAAADQDRWAELSPSAALLAIEQTYAGSESEHEDEELARHLAQALRKERKSAERRLARIEDELRESERASELQRYGELLKTALGELRPGQSEVRLHDFESGDEVVIPLDPALSPKQNLDATFKRYQKLVRRLAKAGAQADGARAAVDAIASIEDELAAAKAAGSAALAALAEREDVARLLRRHTAAKRPEGALPEPDAPKSPFRDLPRRLQPRRYLSADGLEIWVGRSDEGNDYLSTRLARGKDLFFHLDGAPGSHVVLRSGGRSDPPSESVLDACELAVHFSKYKAAGRADVHVVPIKNVKKPKGAKRGLVHVTGGRTVHLRREPARLARLLASRIEE